MRDSLSSNVEREPSIAILAIILIWTVLPSGMELGWWGRRASTRPPKLHLECLVGAGQKTKQNVV